MRVSLLLLAGIAACHDEAPAPPSEPQALELGQTGINTAWMDPKADPCKDFFAYACGGFVRDTVIPSDHATWGTTEAIEKENEAFLKDVLTRAATKGAGTSKLGDYYAACMDEEAIEKAGVTPIADLNDAIAKVQDYASLAALLPTLHVEGVDALFGVAAMQDYKDATQMIAELDQGGIGLPDRDYYFDNDRSMKEVREFYRDHVGKMLALAGVPKNEVGAAVADVLRIETAIAKLHQDKVVRRDPYAVYHRVDRAGLAKLAPSFPWDAYWQGLGFADIQAISVNEPAYYTAIVALMHKEPAKAWRHYLTWQLYDAHARHLGKAFVDQDFALEQKLTGQEALEPRWKRCVHSTDGALGELLAQPYIEAKFAGDSKARAMALTRSIHEAMRAELMHLPWMDEATRAAALQKLDKVNDKVGYPDTFRTYDFPVTRDSFMKNVRASDGFELRRDLGKVGKPVDKHEWFMTPPTVNAYYDPSLNEIVLPAGELQPPFFSKDFYGAVNIGDEGANTIGHELTHAFDDEGSQFDGDGNLRDWWTAKTKKEFEQATQCVQDLYGTFEAVPGVKLNGALTSGENIADIGGVKLGYAALLAWKQAGGEARKVVGYSDEQLFFLAYAQGWCSKEKPEFLETLARTNPHSPPRFRVNGPMSQVPAFAKAYSCAAGTPMNPPKVCAVW